MPQPRRPDGGPDPFAPIPPEEIADSSSLAVAESKAWASDAVHHWMPVVEAILAESEQLRTVNPSVSVVWSVQALEVFLKRSVLGPALRVRLGYDPELGEVIFKALLGHNGPKAAKEWLGHLLGLGREQAMSAGLAGLWSVLFGEYSAMDWRNRIVHQGDVASEDEAQKVLNAVREFIRYLKDFLEPPPGSLFARRQD